MLHTAHTINAVSSEYFVRDRKTFLMFECRNWNYYYMGKIYVHIYSNFYETNIHIQIEFSYFVYVIIVPGDVLGMDGYMMLPICVFVRINWEFHFFFGADKINSILRLRSVGILDMLFR